VPHDKSFNLEAKSKDLWDKLDDKAISTILGYNNGSSNSLTKPPNKPSSFQHKVNLHEMSAYNFIQANSHQVDDSQPDNDSTALPHPPNDSCDAAREGNDTCIVNAASSSSYKLPPGDIHSVVSKSSK
jgi:hypothetical protein